MAVSLSSVLNQDGANISYLDASNDSLWDTTMITTIKVLIMTSYHRIHPENTYQKLKDYESLHKFNFWAERSAIIIYFARSLVKCFTINNCLYLIWLWVHSNIPHFTRGFHNECRLQLSVASSAEDDHYTGMPDPNFLFLSLVFVLPQVYHVFFCPWIVFVSFLAIKYNSHITFNILP